MGTIRTCTQTPVCLTRCPLHVEQCVSKVPISSVVIRVRLVDKPRDRHRMTTTARRPSSISAATPCTLTVRTALVTNWPSLVDYRPNARVYAVFRRADCPAGCPTYRHVERSARRSVEPDTTRTVRKTVRGPVCRTANCKQDVNLLCTWS